MPTFEQCQKCGRQLDYDKRFGSQFCDDKCRTDYHNYLRKIQRLQKRAQLAMEELFEETTRKGNYLRSEPVSALVASIQLATWLSQNVSYQCVECKSQHDVKDGIPVECAYCQRKHFTIKVYRSGGAIGE